MGGSRHKGIGMNRAKKQKVSSLVPAGVGPSEHSESEEEAPVTRPEPEPSSPPPPSSRLDEDDLPMQPDPKDMALLLKRWRNSE